MTVETEISQIRYSSIADGVPLSAPFPVQTADEITVYYGDDLVAEEGTHYTVALDPPDYLTATVTPVTGFAALSDGVISIARRVPYTNTDDIPGHSTLSSSRLEQSIDRVVFMAQQLRDMLVRTVKFPNVDADSARGDLPIASERANKYLTFDANGVPSATETVSIGSLIVSSFGTTWVNLANAASALTTLGFTTIGTIGRSLVAATTAAGARSTIGAVAEADDVDWTGEHTFADTVAFAGAVTVPVPTLNAHPARKGYVDDAVAAAVSGGLSVINQSTSGINYRYLTTVGSGTVSPSAGCKTWEVDFIGSGGGGGGGVGAGGTGGDTTFNSVTASGGLGGGAGTLAAVKPPSGGGPGTGGSGSATRRQTVGRGENGRAGAGYDVDGGAGASTPFGAGGAPGAAAASNTGAGGGGGPGVSPDNSSGGGGPGELVKLVIANPSGNYNYTITAGGAAGSGGGFAGGSGIIRITERFNY